MNWKPGASDGWIRRRTDYKFLYREGASFQARIKGHGSRQSFWAGLGVTEENERFTATNSVGSASATASVNL